MQRGWGVRWLYLDFMALDRQLATKQAGSAEADLKHALRSHARCVLIGGLLCAVLTGASSCIACGPGELAEEEGTRFQTLPPTGSWPATIPDPGADP